MNRADQRRAWRRQIHAQRSGRKAHQRAVRATKQTPLGAAFLARVDASLRRLARFNEQR